jgi:hypothetical protein
MSHQTLQGINLDSQFSFGFVVLRRSGSIKEKYDDVPCMGSMTWTLGIVTALSTAIQARDMIKLLARSVPFPQAKKVLEDEAW